MAVSAAMAASPPPASRAPAAGAHERRAAPVPFDDLPDFADASNRALHAKLRSTDAELFRVEAELSDMCERRRVVAEHMGSVLAEQEHTQRLVTLKAREVDDETHQAQLAERQAAAYAETSRKLLAERERVEAQIRSMRASLLGAAERAERVQMQQRVHQVEK